MGRNKRRQVGVKGRGGPCAVGLQEGRGEAIKEQIGAWQFVAIRTHVA